MPKKITLSDEQSAAVLPTLNVVVQANAGTGKTFVLVQRLLRIMFREFAEKSEKPTGILCLTYTNAGAAEMRNRILSGITEWARATNEELAELLFGIAHTNPPTNADLETARKIFYDFIDNPHALKIQTIHSFCEDILRRFPLEADVPPAWRLVSGAEQRRLLKDAFAELMKIPKENTELQGAFDNILGATSEYSLDGLLESLLDQYKNILLLKRRPNFPAYIIEKTEHFLGVDNPPKKPDFDGNYEQILTKTGKIREKLPPELEHIASAVFEYDQYEKNLKIMRTSRDFLILCDGFADKYIELKNRRGLLDFDDMLYKTMTMFSDPAVMGQVLGQLDFTLKHILVDESQDNSPIMWKIIFNMLDNFWTDGEVKNPRTLFVVGDIKQSIFSFQGASPREFAQIDERIGQIAKNDMRQYETVPLLESRRSAKSILDAVDYFFNTAGLPGWPEKILHKCRQSNGTGRVEINPLFLKSGDDDSDITRKKFIKIVANKIESLIKNEKIPADDIMVLVQRRHPFAGQLCGELKRKNIATAGSDRIILPDFPAVRDFLNLIRFVSAPLDPENDAALAFVLRSPIVGFSEKELYDLCVGRDRERPLFERLREKHPAVYKELADIAARGTLPPYGFFSEIMKRYRKKIIGALGRPVIEPLEEFMTLALSFERTKSGGLLGFLRWFLDGENEIRRDMEKGAGVRVLTAHSSKGLEAPVVFLIDTTRNPKSQTRQKPFKVLNPGPDVFLSRSESVSTDKFAAAQDVDFQNRTEEYWRLLYVAMTRAARRLYVFGCEERGQNASWHSMLYSVLRDMPGAAISDDGIITISGPETVDETGERPDEKNRKKAGNIDLAVPTKPLKDLEIPDAAKKIPISEFMRDFDKKSALSHGTDIHHKLQFLDLNSDDELAVKIKANPEILRFWGKGARAEVPIAGTIGGQFYSFRIDRMIATADEVLFLDYKTDANRARRAEYIEKIGKYSELLRRIYPDKTIRAHILWLCGFELEEII